MTATLRMRTAPGRCWFRAIMLRSREPIQGRQRTPGVIVLNAPRRTRTFDPLIKSQLLYQLS